MKKVMSAIFIVFMVVAFSGCSGGGGGGGNNNTKPPIDDGDDNNDKGDVIAVTGDVTNITSSSAVMHGVSDGDEITKRGFIWNTTEDLFLDSSGAHVIFAENGGAGDFTAYANDITPDTEIFYAAFAIGPEGVFYGETNSFISASVPIDPDPEPEKWKVDGLGGLCVDSETHHFMITERDDNLYLTQFAQSDGTAVREIPLLENSPRKAECRGIARHDQYVYVTCVDNDPIIIPGYDPIYAKSNGGKVWFKKVNVTTGEVTGVIIGDGSSFGGLWFSSATDRFYTCFSGGIEYIFILDDGGNVTGTIEKESVYEEFGNGNVLENGNKIFWIGSAVNEAYTRNRFLAAYYDITSLERLGNTQFRSFEESNACDIVHNATITAWGTVVIAGVLDHEGIAGDGNIARGALTEMDCDTYGHLGTFEYTQESGGFSNTMSDSNGIYATSRYDGMVYKIDISTGIRWKIGAGDGIITGASLHNGVIRLSIGSGVKLVSTAGKLLN